MIPNCKGIKYSDYQSTEEARKAKDQITVEINMILDRDLSLLTENERSIGRWFSLLAEDPEFQKTKEQLDSLENLLADINMYISNMKTLANQD